MILNERESRRMCRLVEVLINLIVLPAIGKLYFAVAGIWGLPYGEQIVGTITAVDTFLGALLGLSAYKYNKTDESVGVNRHMNVYTELVRFGTACLHKRARLCDHNIESATLERFGCGGGNFVALSHFVSTARCKVGHA